jgi:hypothetical protein
MLDVSEPATDLGERVEYEREKAEQAGVTNLL